jgi:hypothetical protein
MAKVKKLSSKELTEVKKLQNEITHSLMNIGNAEIVKNQLATEHLELQNSWKAITSTLEEKYGSVNISLEDGTLSAPDVEEPIQQG